MMFKGKLSFLILFHFSVFSQKTTRFYEYISNEELKNTISVLANDSLEGRNTGEIGQKKAAAFIATKLREYHCQPYPRQRYLLPVELLRKKKSAVLKIGDKIMRYPEACAFVGEYQHHRENFSNLRIIKSSEISQLHGTENVGLLAENFFSFQRSQIPESFRGFLFVFVKKYNSTYFDDKTFLGMTQSGPISKPIVIYVNWKELPETVKKKLGKRELSERIELELNPEQEKIQTENVHAFIEGSDSILKNEVVLVSAHYDHLGRSGSKIFNGADDNASGSAAVLEIARIFQIMKDNGTKMKRSVLFLWFTGEEYGLLGSEYYVRNPIHPLSQTITNLNIDMIGRSDSIAEKEKYTVFVIGSDRLSIDLHVINEQANEGNQKLRFDYTYNDKNEPLRLYERSDHYNFARNNIPSIFYFGGFHDDYHKETDDVEKIDIPKVHEITGHVLKTLIELVNTEKKIR